MEIGYTQWVEEYKPIKNAGRPHAPLNGTMFDTFGVENVIVRNQPLSNVWTWISGDDTEHIVSGYHFVNRLGYFITEKPWDDAQIIVEI